MFTFSYSDAIPSPSAIIPCTAMAVIGKPDPCYAASHATHNAPFSGGPYRDVITSACCSDSRGAVGGSGVVVAGMPRFVFFASPVALILSFSCCSFYHLHHPFLSFRTRHHSSPSGTSLPPCPYSLCNVIIPTSFLVTSTVPHHSNLPWSSLFLKCEFNRWLLSFVLLLAALSTLV